MHRAAKVAEGVASLESTISPSNVKITASKLGETARTDSPPKS